MWNLPFIWIGAVTLFFIVWALAAKLIRRACEKRDAEKQEENSSQEDPSTRQS